MYLLDTNICIYIINKRPEQVVKRIKKFKPNQIKLSSISLGELEYGVSKSKQREKNRNALMDFVSAFDIVELMDSAMPKPTAFLAAKLYYKMLAYYHISRD